MEKVLKIAFIWTFSRQKNPTQKAPRPPAAFYVPYGTWMGLQAI